MYHAVVQAGSSGTYLKLCLRLCPIFGLLYLGGGRGGGGYVCRITSYTTLSEITSLLYYMFVFA